MRSAALAAAFALALVALLGPRSVSAQEVGVDAGGFASYAVDAFDGAPGVGGLLSIDLPLLPLAVRAFAERFFPRDCVGPGAGGGTDDDVSGCASWGGGMDVLLELPMPFLSPYVSGGVVYRWLFPGDNLEGTHEVGAAVGGGVGVGLGDVSLFAEGRRELVEFAAPAEGLEPLRNQWIARAGLTFRAF